MMTAESRPQQRADNRPAAESDSNPVSSLEQQGYNHVSSSAFVWTKWRLIFSLKALRKRIGIRRKRPQGRKGSDPTEESLSFTQIRRTDFNEFSSFDSMSSVMLDHSAARHKIAVRPPQRRRKTSAAGPRPPSETTKSASSLSSITTAVPSVVSSLFSTKNTWWKSGQAEQLVSLNDEENELLKKVGGHNEDEAKGLLYRSRSFRNSEAESKKNVPSSSSSAPASVVRRHSTAEASEETAKNIFKRCRDERNSESSGVASRTEGNDSSNVSEVEIKSCLNSNVIFKRSSPPVLTPESKLKQEQEAFSKAYNGTSVPGYFASTGTEEVNKRERFLTSIEHWTLANEGLKKSICNFGGLNSFSPLLETSLMMESSWNRSNSLDSICSSSFSAEVTKLLDDLNETAQLAFSDEGEDDVETVSADSKDDSMTGEESVNSHTTVDTQKDAENTEMEVHKSNPFVRKVATEDEDELENVNVREMRKVFLFPAAEENKLSCSKSCVNLSRSKDLEEKSFVKALVMKFDRISSQPSSL